jgi:hypothetical protein
LILCDLRLDFRAGMDIELWLPFATFCPKNAKRYQMRYQMEPGKLEPFDWDVELDLAASSQAFFVYVDGAPVRSGSDVLYDRELLRISAPFKPLPQ